MLHSRPAAATHWSVRSVAAESGISKSTVARYFALFGLQPHRSKSFKLSTDPFFVEKVRDVVGLYLNPPDKALVLCVDEKSQVQALERSQPVLPMGLGYVEGVRLTTYYRHGTTTLFGRSTSSMVQSSRSASRAIGTRKFLSFLNHLDRSVPAEARNPSDRRQLRHPQAPQGQSLAGPPSALPPPLHSHLRQLAQSGRALVRAHHPTSDPARFVPQRA